MESIEPMSPAESLRKAATYIDELEKENSNLQNQLLMAHKQLIEMKNRVTMVDWIIGRTEPEEGTLQAQLVDLQKKILDLETENKRLKSEIEGINYDRYPLSGGV